MSGSGSGEATTRDGRTPRSASVRSMARRAGEELSAMTGRPAEGVVSVKRSGEGWTFGVEVVEMHRIPETTDVLAVYDVEMNRAGELLGYRRRTRYVRCRTGDG